MEILWGDLAREFSAREVADQLPDYAYTTIATVLDRLVGKELLQRRLEGRVVMFTAADTRAVHTAELMLEVLNATRDPDGALAAFSQRLPFELADALRAALG